MQGVSDFRHNKATCKQVNEGTSGRTKINVRRTKMVKLPNMALKVVYLYIF